jgi:hypothetical protein
MVLNSRILLMDETQTGIAHQLALPKPIFKNETTQLSSLQLFKKQLSIDSPTTENHSSRKAASSLHEFLKPHSILSQNNSSESDDDDSTHQDEINLYPLTNQVGGHTRLLVLNDKTVIKPLNIRELEFYQNIPGNDIQHFVPKYKGT